MLDHMPLAGRMARDFHSGTMDREELEAEALAALVESATAFDPSRGVPFRCFARLRIQGALRTYRQFVFHASWRGAAEERPVFQRLSFTDDLHGRVLGREPEAPLGHELECREALESAIRLLPRSHSVACRMIYLEGRSREETAAALGVSRGYLSRISADAVNWLAHETRGLLAG
ncbi:MAG: sigma-70 family RNA polymerase sigma factor [Isosphaeraceae bacterium]